MSETIESLFNELGFKRGSVTFAGWEKRLTIEVNSGKVTEVACIASAGGDNPFSSVTIEDQKGISPEHYKAFARSVANGSAWELAQKQELEEKRLRTFLTSEKARQLGFVLEGNEVSFNCYKGNIYRLSRLFASQPEVLFGQGDFLFQVIKFFADMRTKESSKK